MLMMSEAAESRWVIWGEGSGRWKYQQSSGIREGNKGAERKAGAKRLIRLTGETREETPVCCVQV